MPASLAPPIHLLNVSALVLAGGQGMRMGGVDKGLQLLRGQPLVSHALVRLNSQAGGALAHVAISANRNIEQYQSLGFEVVSDVQDWGDYQGPMAGFHVGLQRCGTDYLLCVPCDAPQFPLDLAQRLMQAIVDGAPDCKLAMAATTGPDGRLVRQPVFALMHRSLAPSLEAFLNAGERKIAAWAHTQGVAWVVFEHEGDFANANTASELASLEAGTGADADVDAGAGAGVGGV
jgi:molybdenum cofactor guanylyltransferase